MTSRPPAPRLRLAALLALCCACTGAGEAGSPGDGAGKMVAQEELPARYREVIQAWREHGEAWRRVREEALVDPELADFLVSNLIDVMVDSYAQGRIASAGEVAGPFERARQDLVVLRWYAAPVLTELLVVGDSVVAVLAADTLAQMDDPTVVLPVARKLLEPERESRRRAAELLGRLPNALADEPQVDLLLGRALTEDPEWSVRAQAATAIGERATRAREVDGPRHALSVALSDPDPAVVESAARALGRIGDPRAIPALLALLERLVAGGERVKTYDVAQQTLLRLSGERASKTPSEWREWYRTRIEAGGGR